MQINKKTAVIEAILFASGEAIEVDRLSAAAEVEAEMVPRLITMLNDRYEQNESALLIRKLGDSYQLTTRPQFAPNIHTALETRRQQPLSNAAMEVLAIIAYNQPVTKSFVESVRGVDSSGTVNTLTERGLLEEAGRLDVPGRPISYRTTSNFLRCFGLSSLEDLPPLPKDEDQLSFDELEQEEVTAKES